MNEDYSEKVENILAQLKKAGIEKIVALSGSVPVERELDSRKIVRESFEVYKNFKVAIQTGGTNFDIQKYSAEFAKQFGIPLIGIYPSKGEKYKLQGLDFALEVKPRFGSSEWGDDSEIFAKLPNGVEMIGGSIGTLIEFGHIMKINDDREKQKKKPVYIAPVLVPNSNLFTNHIFNLPLKDSQKEFMGWGPFFEGRTAAEFLIKKMYN